MMKHLSGALIASVILLSCVSPARADDATRAAKAEELLRILQSDQIMKSIEPMMKSMMAGVNMPADQRAKVAEVQQRIMVLTTDRLNKAIPALAQVYAETYTEEEIDGLLAFYKSPVGKSFLQKMPLVTQRSVPVMMGLMTDLQVEVKKITEEMKLKAK